jgi:hypothetical protein
LKIYTTFKDVQMILKRFFDISTGFRFSKISVECSVHSCSCPWLTLSNCYLTYSHFMVLNIQPSFFAWIKTPSLLGWNLNWNLIL